MTRFRLVSTLIALSVGAGMAASYMTAGTPAVPERINAEGILPADPAARTFITPDLEPLAREAASASDQVQPSAPPTVALPSGPLLRSATEAAPIDTSALQPDDPVRHAPGSEALRPASLDLGAAEAGPAPIERPASITRVSPRRSKSRPRSAHSSKKVQQLFLNPLGTR